MTKVKSKRTGIKCCLLEDKSSCIITVNHLPCIFKHLAPNISIKCPQEASCRKHSASQAFINRLDRLLENTTLTTPCWVNIETINMHFEKRSSRGVFFYNGCDYGLQLCSACEYITLKPEGFKIVFALREVFN